MFNLQELRDLRSIHLSFHGMHEKESDTKNWIKRDSRSAEKTLLYAVTQLRLSIVRTIYI